MYFKNHKSRDIFCFSEGHELLLSDSRTIETGFYSQNRSKIMLRDGERRCVVGVQFATCASVPVYSSVMQVAVSRRIPATAARCCRILVTFAYILNFKWT